MIPIGAIMQGAMGIAQMVSASQAASELDDPTKYKESDALKKFGAMAEKGAKQGFTGAQRANFEQGLSRSAATGQRAIENIGAAGAARGIAGIFANDARGQFAADSAKQQYLNQQMFGKYADASQGVQDAETSRYNAELAAKRAAIEKTQRSGMENMMGGVSSSIGSFTKGAAGNSYINAIDESYQGGSPFGDQDGMGTSMGFGRGAAPGSDGLNAAPASFGVGTNTPGAQSLSLSNTGGFSGNASAGLNMAPETFPRLDGGTSVSYPGVAGSSPMENLVLPEGNGSNMNIPDTGVIGNNLQQSQLPITLFSYNPNNPNNPNNMMGGEVLPNSMFGINPRKN